MMLSRPPGTLSEEEAAASLFMNKRTLARKLKQENSSFRQIRDDILSQQAASYLCDSKLSIEDIAALMNYYDSANFRRAFKRWFGQPPEQYRQRVMSQDSLPTRT
jgi:AraC-like DNA-binding protein